MNNLIPSSSSSFKLSFHIIVAATQKGGIGFQNDLPWTNLLKEDLRHFKEITNTITDSTKQNVLIMGRKTWDSIPASRRPLSNRINIVLSRTPSPSSILEKEQKENIPIFCSSLEQALELCSSLSTQKKIEQVFVMGGAQIYNEAFLHPLCDQIYYTQILQDFECDTFIEPINQVDFELIQLSAVKVENQIPFQFLTFQKKQTLLLPKKRLLSTNSSTSFNTNQEEMQYLNLIQKILTQGVLKGDRTGTGTFSIFGEQMRFSLRNNSFPLITTKKVFWRGVVEELLWLIRGSTDSKELAEKKVHIWDDNGSREFLDKMGFTERKVGDLGPVSILFLLFFY